MENVNVNQEIMQEMTQLLDKTAVESFAPVLGGNSDPEAMLINLKNTNARYDKNEAITQVRGLMEKYNIQIDEVVEMIHY